MLLLTLGRVNAFRANDRSSYTGTLFDLQDEIAVVTGSLGKLGPVWIEALLEAGARVVGVDLPGHLPSPSIECLRSKWHSEKLLLLDADVRERESLERALVSCQNVMGSPSILVNNAGIDQPPTPKNDVSKPAVAPIDSWRRMLDVNLIGAFQASQVFGEPMLERRHGTIINIGSLYASVSPDQRLYAHIPQSPPFLKPPAYGASKAALVNLTMHLATLWAPFGVRVNALSPGGVLGGQDAEFQRKFTERVPLQRMAESLDLKGPLIFLASQAARYVTGIELRVDGGFTAW
jgi:NAD(P)-dependent dehydrogenase (short-subunit alcohol dehydrogenase family)